jgi:hypothetical protein
MKQIFWLLVIAAAAGFAYWVRSWRRRWMERKRASQERFATFMAQATVAARPQQKLLLEAAAKADEAGEPVLSIQLYARLMARYPDSPFAAQARAAVEQLKKNLANA